MHPRNYTLHFAFFRDRENHVLVATFQVEKMHPRSCPLHFAFFRDRKSHPCGGALHFTIFQQEESHTRSPQLCCHSAIEMSHHQHLFYRRNLTPKTLRFAVFLQRMSHQKHFLFSFFFSRMNLTPKALCFAVLCNKTVTPETVVGGFFFFFFFCVCAFIVFFFSSSGILHQNQFWCHSATNLTPETLHSAVFKQQKSCTSNTLNPTLLFFQQQKSHTRNTPLFCLSATEIYT